MRPPILATNVLPRGWRDFLAATGPIGIGVDPATTTKAKSNPTGVALTQKVGEDFIVRVVLRFKTSDGDATEQVVRELLDLPHALRCRKVVIDATNERFFAIALKKKLAGKVVVEPVVSSENAPVRGRDVGLESYEKMTFKTYLGNLLVNTMEDGHLLLPREEWLRDDLRAVKRDRGGFAAEVDADGNHADCFDAIKNSLYALIGAGAGPAESVPAQVGTFGQGHGDRTGVRGPIGRMIAAVKRLC
jgi:hypothetical protein